MDSRFKVSIRYTGKHKDNSNDYTHSDYNDYEPLKFYPEDILAERKINIFDMNIPRAQEYHDIFLKFKSDDSDAKMMIPDLNDYDIQGAHSQNISDKTVIYFSPQYESIPVYKIEDGVQPVPLSADIYTIIVEDNHHKYYSYFRVVSKELNSFEWKSMIQDLEQVSREMVHENIHKYHRHLSLSDSEQADILFQPLLDNYQRIMNYIHIILANPRYKIAKSYRWVKLGQEQFIDQITVRKMNEMPTVNGWIYAPHRYLNYDIEDNRWIKFIVMQILERANLALKHYQLVSKSISSSHEQQRNHNYYGHTGSELVYDKRHYVSEHRTLYNNIKKLSKLRNYLFYVMHNSLLSKLHRIKGFIPKGLILSPKYNALYRLYLELKNNHINNHLAPQIEQYRYKPTSELYEVWTVLEVIKALEHCGYQGIKGWIFDNHVVVPTLKLNSKIFMKSNNGDNIYLVVVYNKALSKRIINRYTNEPFNNGEEPLYVSWRHNRPDIRVDIFKDKTMFLGSIILDAKYKKLSSLLNFERGSGSVHDQLMAYRDITTYPSVSVNHDNFRAVPIVYALYPSKDNRNESQNYKTYLGNHIRLIQLRPGNKDTFIKFADNISTVLNTRIKTVEQKIKQKKQIQMLNEMLRQRKDS